MHHINVVNLNISESMLLDFLNSLFPDFSRTELALKIANMYLTIQQTDEGYDYSLFNSDLKLFDGGVYDDISISIVEALAIVIANEEHLMHTLQFFIRSYGLKGMDLSELIKEADYNGVMYESGSVEDMNIFSIKPLATMLL